MHYRTTWFVTVVVALALCAPALALNPGTDVIVAAAGAAAGKPPSYWMTDLVIFNPGPGAAAVVVYYLPRGTDNSSPTSQQYTLEAGETLVRYGIVKEDFGVESFGALRVTSDAQVVVSSVTRNLPAGGASTAPQAGSFGQGFAGIPVSAGVAAGSATHVAGVSETTVERTNYGLVDVSGSGSTVRVSLLDTDGAVLAQQEHTMQAWEPGQTNVSTLGAGQVADGTLRFEVLSGKAVVYASRVNNQSGDASTLEMYWSCGGSRDGADGTYHFTVADDAGKPIGGGQLMVSSGQATVCGNLVFLDRTPGCAYWLPFCTTQAASLGELAAGVDAQVTYSDAGAGVGDVAWTISMTVTDNLEVDGTINGTGSGWTGPDAGCNGSFGPATVRGGIR